MPRSRSRGRCRGARPASPVVHCAEDALELLLVACPSPTRPQAAALLLDDRHRVVAAVTGADEPGHGIEQLCEALADVWAHDEVTSVVLASVDPDPAVAAWPLGYELRWSLIEAQLDVAGIRLLDWFVIVGGYGLSVSELVLDSDPPWAPPTMGP